MEPIECNTLVICIILVISTILGFIFGVFIGSKCGQLRR